MTDFVHLHCHSEYSLLDGMSTPQEMAKTSSRNGQYASAITDHGTMGGVLKFQDACIKENVKVKLWLQKRGLTESVFAGLDDQS